MLHLLIFNFIFTLVFNLLLGSQYYLMIFEKLSRENLITGLHIPMREPGIIDNPVGYAMVSFHTVPP